MFTDKTHQLNFQNQTRLCTTPCLGVVQSCQSVWLKLGSRFPYCFFHGGSLFDGTPLWRLMDDIRVVGMGAYAAIFEIAKVNDIALGEINALFIGQVLTDSTGCKRHKGVNNSLSDGSGVVVRWIDALVHTSIRWVHGGFLQCGRVKLSPKALALGSVMKSLCISNAVVVVVLYLARELADGDRHTVAVDQCSFLIELVCQCRFESVSW